MVVHVAELASTTQRVLAVALAPDDPLPVLVEAFLFSLGTGVGVSFEDANLTT